MDVIRKHFKTIGSTNTWAKQHAHDLPQDKLLLITADEQTAGRGRFKRTWISPPREGIYATFCFFVEKHRSDIGNIPQVLAISAAEALKGLNLKPTLKWPNDLLLEGKKTGGILCETTPIADKLCVAAGIGINVNMPSETFMKIDRPATSLMVNGSRPYETESVLKSLEMHFSENLEHFLDKGFYPFLGIYRNYMAYDTVSRMHFDDSRRVWEGCYHSINDDGSLNMRLDSGEIKTFIAGEILFYTETY